MALKALRLKELTPCRSCSRSLRLHLQRASWASFCSCRRCSARASLDLWLHPHLRSATESFRPATRSFSAFRSAASSLRIPLLFSVAFMAAASYSATLLFPPVRGACSGGNCSGGAWWLSDSGFGGRLLVAWCVAWAAYAPEGCRRSQHAKKFLGPVRLAL